MEDKDMLMIRNDYQPVLSDFFNDIFDGEFNRSMVFKPKTNITETEKSYEVEMMVPGFDKKDFEVNIDKDLLTVSVSKEEKAANESEGKVLMREFGSESFSRSFTLTQDVDVNKIEASYENGILKLTIPKKKETVIKKLIKIK